MNDGIYMLLTGNNKGELVYFQEVQHEGFEPDYVLWVAENTFLRVFWQQVPTLEEMTYLIGEL